MSDPTLIQLESQKEISFQIARECKLMNNRTMWCLQFAGLLFVGLQLSGATSNYLALIIPIAGIGIGITNFIGIRGAQASILNYVKLWEDNLEKIGFVRPIAKHSDAKRGRVAELAPAVIVISLWAMIFAININQYVKLSCSRDMSIIKSFTLAKGSEIVIQRELNTSNTDKELIFNLMKVPESKKDRDYSDFINVILIDSSGNQYMPESITDMNGAKRDIIAVFNKIPNGTKLQTIRIRALQDLKGTEIRWWSGKLH